MLILARHGTTANNVAGKIIGLTDHDIIESGQRQAALLADEIKRKYRVSHIFNSTLIRAKSTAEILCHIFGINAIADERLVERDFGPFEGLSRPELQRSRAIKGLSVNDPTQDWTFDLSVEQDAEVFARFLSFCRSYKIFELSQAKDIVIVSHANFIKCIVYNLIAISTTTPKAFKITEASFIAFHVELPSIFELRELWQNPLKK